MVKTVEELMHSAEIVERIKAEVKILIECDSMQTGISHASVYEYTKRKAEEFLIKPQGVE
jgi:D-serine deaminase-like pyridoxal phosphate-dependent protein